MAGLFSKQWPRTDFPDAIFRNGAASSFSAKQIRVDDIVSILNFKLSDKIKSVVVFLCDFFNLSDRLFISFHFFQ